jgi:hypothetical protein
MLAAGRLPSLGADDSGIAELKASIPPRPLLPTVHLVATRCSTGHNPIIPWPISHARPARTPLVPLGSNARSVHKGPRNGGKAHVVAARAVPTGPSLRLDSPRTARLGAPPAVPIVPTALITVCATVPRPFHARHACRRR